MGWDITCEHCSGEVRVWPTPEAKKLYKEWEAPKPPVGEGWQLWNTTFDGPVTPVFDSAEKLARHCANFGVSAGGDETLTYEGWLTFITKYGWAPLAMGSAGDLKSGPAYLVTHE